MSISIKKKVGVFVCMFICLTLLCKKVLDRFACSFFNNYFHSVSDSLFDCGKCKLLVTNSIPKKLANSPCLLFNVGILIILIPLLTPGRVT